MSSLNCDRLFVNFIIIIIMYFINYNRFISKKFLYKLLYIIYTYKYISVAKLLYKTEYEGTSKKFMRVESLPFA